MNKKEVLRESIELYKPDAIIGYETWLNPTIPDNKVLPNGYKLHHKDRADRYGGVLIGMKSGYEYEALTLNVDSEICAISIKMS